MKTKELIASLLLLMSASVMSAQPASLPVRPGIPDPSHQGGGNKAPVQLPQVWIEDYTLTFDASCVGCMIEIVQDGEVVYTTFVDLNGEVTLPSTLSGTLQLVIYRGDQTFIGEFEL